MIYLIEGKDYLKIGFTKDLEKVLTNFHRSNCHNKLIDWIYGTVKDKKELHKLCLQYYYKRGWYHNTLEVKQLFQKYKETHFSLNIKENVILYYQYRAVLIKGLWTQDDREFTITKLAIKELGKQFPIVERKDFKK